MHIDAYREMDFFVCSSEITKINYMWKLLSLESKLEPKMLTTDQQLDQLVYNFTTLQPQFYSGELQSLPLYK